MKFSIALCFLSIASFAANPTRSTLWGDVDPDTVLSNALDMAVMQERDPTVPSWAKDANAPLPPNWAVVSNRAQNALLAEVDPHVSLNVDGTKLTVHGRTVTINAGGGGYVTRTEVPNIVTNTATDAFVGRYGYVKDSITNGVNASLTAEVARLDLKIDNATPGDYSNVSNLAVSALQPSDIVNTVESDETNKVLSAKMGKELESQILNIKQRGRYLSIWDSATGFAKTTATVSPYEYKAGDYFIVGTVAAEGDVNYKPDGKAYTNGVPTLTVETNAVHPNDTYYFDSTTWTLVKYDVNLEAYATKEWVSNKNYVTESVTNGILASAKSYADGYANQAPDYAAVSNRAMTAAQYGQYLDRSSFGAIVDTLSAGYLIAKSRNAGITTTSPKVLFGSESIGSEGSVYGELGSHWPGNQLSFKSCKVVRDPDFGRLTVSNLYTVAFPEKSGVLALRDELTVFSADASGKKMSAVTPPDAEGHTTTNSVPYTSYVDAATNGLLSASAAELAYKPISWVPAWGDVTGKPQFAAVATSGSYTDLSNKPDLSAYATEAFVTNRVAAAEALVNQSPCWSTAGAWGIEYKLSATSSSQTIVTGWTNEDGRAWSQMRTHYVRNLEADCFGALYDEITIEALRVGGWRCLTAGGSITAAGHLTANASGVYVVSATNQNGQIRFAEIPISNGAQDVADVEVYVGDVAGTARKAVNDEALAWMNAAPNHGAGIYGTESTWYNWGYFTQPAWAATSAANTGNDKPFALGTKLLAGATHYPDWCKWEGFQTIGSTTVKKGEWVRLDHWALSNGWNGAQVAAMNLSDISLVLVTEGSIPLADCPYLITEAKLNETFAGTLEGVQGWAATQMHADPIQLVYSTADGTAWRYAMGSECNRLDIKTKLLTMGSAYPIHSGDSGHPVYLHHDNKWVLTSHFYSAANGPSYVKALPVIRAFAASVGCSLNVIE